ncbi:hypothetical protein [Nocardia sp. alder85J]|uniref:hypothetical protein n=1 Tax=Nocardia sp. alder85J TaxID=2862949 RepID=UPI001CD69FCD|nr:hypothetical protein [Nocardia sp. alder85J]MCX4095130.1 hypothetical protein [Nocardia sp. alder85J]
MPGRSAAAQLGGRDDLRAAALVALAVILVSAVAGIAWGVLAPYEKALVVDSKHGAPLTGESAHRFDAMAMFLAFAAATGLLCAVGAWRLARRLRGPLLEAGVLLGSLIGTGVMVWVGETVARLAHPRPSDPVLHTVVEVAATVDGGFSGKLLGITWPVLHAGPALVVQPLVASLAILILAALSTSEDLHTGRGRAVPGEPPYLSEISYGPYGAAPVDTADPRS